MMFRPLLPLAMSAALLAAPLCAFAQDSDSDYESTNTARIEVKLTQLEEQVRRMQGVIEQISYQNKQLRSELEKNNGDIQYRLQALENRQNSAPAAASAPSSSSSDNDTMQAVAPTRETPEDNPPAQTTPASTEKYANSRDHYNHAFRLMQQAQYAQAGSSFVAFTQNYPHDPLIGNAYYWLGETYYVRREYPQAADNFRQGYEAMPSGPKAADNLLKLAMSLNAMKKDSEACVVLKQVVSKYGSGASSVKPRAEQEINRIGCN